MLYVWHCMIKPPFRNFGGKCESGRCRRQSDKSIRCKKFIAPGTSDGYAEVDFLGIDGRRYRSRWSVRRTRNKISGSLQPQTLEVKELDTEKEFQGTKKELLIQLVELVGLTYEQFTRTVLLAQNDFATFPKSKGVPKRSCLRS